MGILYRRRVRVCTTCALRLDTTRARERCEGAGHTIDERETPIWWLRYRAEGRTVCVSSDTADRGEAEALLARLDPASQTPPPAPPINQQRPAAPAGSFIAAAEALLTDYRMNGKRSLGTATSRLTHHLLPAFSTLQLAEITTPLIRQFAAARQAEGAANATVNRDLTTLKRIFSIAVQDGTLARKPYIPLLKEQNVRRGFFEVDQLDAIRRHLPEPMRAIPRFAFVTGWRTPSEIIPLEWRQVDWDAEEVRLDSGTTKNGDGRVFPFTTELRTLLEAQRDRARVLAARGIEVRHVFVYDVGKKAGRPITERGYHHAWKRARRAAGLTDRISHDLRRTAVRNLVRAGVPERVAMQLTGHKTRAVFERYNIVSPGDLREAAMRLDQFLVPSPGM